MHFDEGGDASVEVRFLEEAARRAMQRSGYIEALAQLARGLELTALWPESAGRAERQMGGRETPDAEEGASCGKAVTFRPWRSSRVHRVQMSEERCS